MKSCWVMNLCLVSLIFGIAGSTFAEDKVLALKIPAGSDFKISFQGIECTSTPTISSFSSCLPFRAVVVKTAFKVLKGCQVDGYVAPSLATKRFEISLEKITCYEINGEKMAPFTVPVDGWVVGEDSFSGIPLSENVTNKDEYHYWGNGGTATGIFSHPVIFSNKKSGFTDSK